MATVKEVQLMDGENEVTPYTLIDSVWDTDRKKKFKENVYTMKDVDDMVEALQNAITELKKWV